MAVMLATCTTGIPASVRVFAVPPVDRMVMPWAWRARARVSISVLSATEISAVLMGVFWVIGVSLSGFG